MSNKSLLKNYIYNISYQLLMMIIPLITLPYVSRVLGAEGIGMYGYTNSITQYFILFGCIGLNLYGQREIAYHQENVIERTKIFYELMLLRFISIFFCISIFIVFTCNDYKYGFLFKIQLMDIIAALVDISWFFQGLEDFKKITLRNSCVKLLGLVLIFCFVNHANDLWIYVLIYSSTLFFGNISMWIYLHKYLCTISCKMLNIKRHIKPALQLFVPQIATSIYTLLDKSMVGFLTGNDVEVAYYEQAQKIVKMALTIPTSLGTIMLPRIASMHIQGKKEEIYNYLYKSIRFSCMLSFPICFGIIAIADKFIPWFFGDGYDGVIINLVYMSPVIIIIGISNVIGVQFFLPVGRQSEYTKSVIMGTLVNLIMNFIFIPYFLSYGAVIATVIAELSVTCLQLMFIRKEFSIKMLVKSIYKYALASLIMFLVVCIINYINNNYMIISILIGIMVYTSILLVMKEELCMQVCKSIFKR